MDWFKVEARIAWNEKVHELSANAFRALVFCWGYAMQQENAGRVPASAPRLIPAVTPRLLAELEAAGFLEPNGDGGWHIHDWDVHQAEALQVQEKRRRDAARKRVERASERVDRERGGAWRQSS